MKSENVRLENTISREIKLPNFLIVGAAKSGTTALYYFLKAHPEIYMSPVKEPKFITSNFLKYPFNGPGDYEIEKKIIKRFEDYCLLFKKVTLEKAIGEASADNLYYYEDSIHYIKKFLREPKIIIILRNPVERAYSAYLHLVRDGRERLSFEEALEREEERMKKNWEFIWFYKDVGFYYAQVKAYLNSFEKVKVCLYEDLQNAPSTLLKEIYTFLEVDPNFVQDTSAKYNISGVPLSRRFHNFLINSNPLKEKTKSLLNIFFTEEQLGRMVEFLKVKNLYKPRIKKETREYLKKLYREDILKLQELINRDLRHWLE